MNLLKIVALAFFVSPALAAEEIPALVERHIDMNHWPEKLEVVTHPTKKDDLDISLEHFFGILKEDNADTTTYSVKREGWGPWSRLMSGDECVLASFNKKTGVYEAALWCHDTYIPTLYKFPYAPSVARSLFVNLEKRAIKLGLTKQEEPQKINQIDKLDVDLNHFGEITKQESAENLVYYTEREDFSAHTRDLHIMYEKLFAIVHKKDNTYSAQTWYKVYDPKYSESHRYQDRKTLGYQSRKDEYTPTIAKLLFVKLEAKHQQQLAKAARSEQSK